MDLGACSPVLEVEVRDASGTPVAVSTPTQVSLSGGPLTFFSSSDCSGASVAIITIPTGASRAAFHFRSQMEGTFPVRASAGGLLYAEQSNQIYRLPDAIVISSIRPNPVRAGECVPAAATVQRMGVPLAVHADTTVSLTTTLPGGMRFFSDSACTQPTTVAIVSAFQSVATFAVVPVIGRRQSLTVTLPAGPSAAQEWTPRPMVRRGQCALMPMEASRGCSFSPGVLSTSAAFVVAQATSASSAPGEGQVACHFAYFGDAVYCVRSSSIVGAEVHYQVVEVPRGLQVQHANDDCPASFALSPPVDPSRAFVLKAVTNGGSQFDADDLTSYWLTSNDTLTRTELCDKVRASVLQWDGVQVTRGRVDAGSDLALSLPDAGLQVAVLVQATTSVDVSNSACSYFVRGEFVTGGLHLSRGATCASTIPLTLSYERIDFGSRAAVQQRTALVPSMAMSVDVPVTPVDSTRTFVFASNQSFAGQGAGDYSGTSFAGGLFQTRLRANPDGGYLSDTVTVQRAAAGAAAATITFYVVQVEP
ncbi:MAG: hypothetical protein IT380_03065 [Myxococcales bacterium]|nr:hypothetical protein [Myxococcales bacterium]